MVLDFKWNLNKFIFLLDKIGVSPKYLHIFTPSDSEMESLLQVDLNWLTNSAERYTHPVVSQFFVFFASVYLVMDCKNYSCTIQFIWYSILHEKGYLQKVYRIGCYLWVTLECYKCALWKAFSNYEFEAQWNVEIWLVS